MSYKKLKLFWKLSTLFMSASGLHAIMAEEEPTIKTAPYTLKKEGFAPLANMACLAIFEPGILDKVRSFSSSRNNQSLACVNKDFYTNHLVWAASKPRKICISSPEIFKAFQHFLERIHEDERIPPNLSIRLYGSFSDIVYLTPIMGKIRSLSLAENYISNRGIESLTTILCHIHLTTLNLEANDIGLSGAKALATSPQIMYLTSLDLGRNSIGDEGVKALAESPHAIHLNKLSLRCNRIGPLGAESLAKSPHFKHLTMLDIGANYLGDAGVKVLAKSSHLIHLTSLDLGCNSINAAGAEALAESPCFVHLIDLKLGFNHICSPGATALATSPHLERLSLLDVGANNIGPEGMLALEALVARGVRVEH